MLNEKKLMTNYFDELLVQPVPETSSSLTFIEFVLNNKKFAVPIDLIKKVATFSKDSLFDIPTNLPWQLGNYRCPEDGSFYLVDIGHWLTDQISREHKYIIMLSNCNIAFLCDLVSSATKYTAEQISNHEQWGSSWVKGEIIATGSIIIDLSFLQKMIFEEAN